MYRIGQSTDIHPLVKNRDLILGGVRLPYKKGLLGHSDGDALLHAIAEAILGAMGLYDLGHYFKDTDASIKDISSKIILSKVNKMMLENNYNIVNIDSLIILQEPKLFDYIDLMRRSIASILNIKVENINIKATRGEKLGFVGHKKGVVAQAIVLLNKK